MADVTPEFHALSLGFEVERLRRIREALEADNVFLRGLAEQLSAKNLELESRLLNQAEPAGQE